MITIIVAAGIVLFVEFYSLGIFFAAKKMGYDTPYKNFIPFYSFVTTRKLSGEFTILTIPVKKMARMMIFLSVVTILALIYAEWGSVNLPTNSAESLWQIMLLIVGVCAFVFYLAIVISSVKVFRRFNVKNEYLYAFFGCVLITLPILYSVVVKEKPKTDEEMY